MSSLKIGVVQLSSIDIDDKKLNFYIKSANKRGVELLLFGEYILNSFFKELTLLPRETIEKQTRVHIDLLKNYSIKYNIIFIAPVVYIDKKGRYFKRVVKITPSSITYYQQQILIPYSHWNEKEFFSNQVAPLKMPMVFKLNGFKIMVIGGFELHFSKFWEMVQKGRVDLVLLPTASTFDSSTRWREILKTKAFLNGCYILRANRLGRYIDNLNGIDWKFYGDSMLISPSGEVISMLEDKESMLIETINKKSVKEHRIEWGFENELKIRAKKSKKYIKNGI